MSREDMLAQLVAQAADDGVDLLTLRAIVEEASELSVQRVLVHMGLDDEGAQDDLTELRQLLKAWRDAKQSAQRAVVDWVVRGAAGAAAAWHRVPLRAGGAVQVSVRFAGYAALFDARDSGRDVIRKGAFERTLAARKDPLPLYWQHRPEQRIGWIESIAEDTRGLRVVGSIDNPDGAAGMALQRRAVSGLSFGSRATAGATCRGASCSTSICTRSAWSRIRCSTARGCTSSARPRACSPRLPRRRPDPSPFLRPPSGRSSS